MVKVIDACGRSCPEPVIMAKKALSSGEKCYEVLVDNRTAVENVSRFAESEGYTVQMWEDNTIFHLLLETAK